MLKSFYSGIHRKGEIIDAQQSASLVLVSLSVRRGIMNLALKGDYVSFQASAALTKVPYLAIITSVCCLGQEDLSSEGEMHKHIHLLSPFSKNKGGNSSYQSLLCLDKE